MALTHVAALRNTLADAVDAAINAGTTDTEGDIILKASSTEIVTIDFQDPAFGVASAGIITLAGVPLNANAGDTGVVDNFEIRDRDNALVLSGTVTGTGGGGDIEMDNTSVTSGQNVEITSLTYAASA